VLSGLIRCITGVPQLVLGHVKTIPKRISGGLGPISATSLRLYLLAERHGDCLKGSCHPSHVTAIGLAMVSEQGRFRHEYPHGPVVSGLPSPLVTE
jgi:hypothetical protein